MSLAPRQAQSMLEKQIEILDGLRNATTRAVEFREWRQFTLTLIERVWPDQPARAQRFRRVPFSPASSRADDRFAREAFERGCAEARRLLQLWSAEIAAHGLDHAAESSRLADAVRTLGDATPDPDALEFAPVGDLEARDDDDDDTASESDEESEESFEEDDEPVRAAPPPRAPSPAPAQRPPAPPQARSQGTPQGQRPQSAPQRPAPQPPQRPASPPQRPGGQRPQPPPARPAAPPQRAAEPQRGKGAKGKRRDPLKEMLGLDQELQGDEMGMPEFESTLGSSRQGPTPPAPSKPAPPAGASGDDNPLRRLLKLELEALEQDGIEEHDGEQDAGETAEPRLEIENNAFLGHTEGSSAAPLASGGTDDEFRPLDSEDEDEPQARKPERPAAPSPRAPQPDRRAPSPQRSDPSAARPQAPAARPAPPAHAQRSAPPAQAQRPAPPARPAQLDPRASQRPAAPPPARPAPPPPRGAPPQPQRPAPPAQGQRPGPGGQTSRPSAPSNPPAGQRPTSSGAKPPARAAAPPASLEVERFERPEPMPSPERRSSKKRRERPEVDEEFDDADPLADALGAALDRVRTEGSGDEDEDEDDYDSDEDEESDDDDDHRPGLGNVHMVSYVARTFIGLAADVDEMGIPESHQERVRLALLDLAHYLDTGNVTWSILRDAITLVMHYPTLGRQALPLLLPYIETAA